MRQLYFLLPGTTSKFSCGGLFAELKTLKLAQTLCRAEVVTYRQREAQTLFLDDLLKTQTPKTLQDSIFVMSWGFDVPKLAARLKSFNAIYHAHSSGYGFRLPAQVPIITVSRNSMGYWGQQSPHALIYYLQNEISDHFYNRHQPRDIDVLVHERKSSQYLLHELIPALAPHCKVHVIRDYVEDLAALFNRAKVYLYDSAEYWAMQGVSEGFGLQPLEAIACGCQVFSSVNGGLADYLDPGFNAYKIAGYSFSYDLNRILKVVHTIPPTLMEETFLAECRRERIVSRLEMILNEINTFFDNKEQFLTPITPLTPFRIWQLRTQTLSRKIRSRVWHR